MAPAAITRVISASSGGVLISVVLLWTMQQMLTLDDEVRRVESERTVMEFVRLKRSSEAKIKEREKPPPEPPKEEIPPRPPQVDLEMSVPRMSTPKIAFSAPNLPLSMGGPYLGPVQEGPPDREFMVITRVPPQYPYRAERKGIEGWVKVSFLITEQGDVQDVVLVDSKPKGIFDNAAAKAVMRWKFKPRIVDGKPAAARAEQVLTFRLEKGKG